jgi:hypothetical protein
MKTFITLVLTKISSDQPMGLFRRSGRAFRRLNRPFRDEYREVSSKIPQILAAKLKDADLSKVNQSALIWEVIYETMHALDPIIPKDPTGEIREMLESELHRQIVPLVKQIFRCEMYGVLETG